MTNTWYYKKDGEQFGPHSVQELTALVQEGTLHSETPVSSDGKLWKAAKKLDWFQEIESDSGPSKLKSQALKLEWSPILKAAVPTTALLFPFVALQVFSPLHYGTSLAFITYYVGAVLLTYVLYVIDCRKKAAEGYCIPPKWTILLTPAYFWYRSQYLKKPQIGYIGGWFGAQVLMLILVFGAGPWTLQGQAVDMVDKILSNNTYTASLTCEHLEFTEEYGEGRYEAKLLLSNGSSARAAVKVEDNGFVIVRVYGL